MNSSPMLCRVHHASRPRSVRTYALSVGSRTAGGFGRLLRYQEKPEQGSGCARCPSAESAAGCRPGSGPGPARAPRRSARRRRSPPARPGVTIRSAVVQPSSPAWSSSQRAVVPARMPVALDRHRAQRRARPARPGSRSAPPARSRRRRPTARRRRPAGWAQRREAMFTAYERVLAPPSSHGARGPQVGRQPQRGGDHRDARRGGPRR